MSDPAPLTSEVDDMRAGAAAARANGQESVYLFVRQWADRLQSLAHSPAATQPLTKTYDDEANGWIIRDGERWIATCVDEPEADKYIAVRSSQPPLLAPHCEGGGCWLERHKSTALLVRQAFLPANPNKLRNARPDVVQAAKDFIALAEQPTATKEGNTHG